MNNSIVETSRYLEDIGLIYIPGIDKTGIHIAGLSRLLNCHPQTIKNLLESRQVNQVLEAETQTATGLKTIKFILEDGVIEVLEAITLAPKVKIETKQQAMALYRKLALAGFKLYAMMQVAPERLGMSAAPAREPAKQRLRGLMSLDRAQLRDLWIYQEAAQAGVKPDAELAAKIDPDFFGVTVEAARYAFYLKDLQYNEDALASQRVARELWLVGEDARLDEAEDLGYIADSRKMIKQMESLGYNLAAAAFDSAYQSLRGSGKLAIEG